MSNFGYEIDFLPVGNGLSGDAIAVRYGIAPNYKIMIVDGGMKESGIVLVNHIQKYYKTNRVDYVVNTHPDKDHASGLTEVLKNLEVGELWIHRPWIYSEYIIDYINKNPVLRIDGRVTINSFQKRLAEVYYKYAGELETIAEQKGIAIKEPYEGAQIGDFYVLSPNKKWYLQDLIPNANKTQEIVTEDSKFNIWASIKEKIFNIRESLGFETLKDGGETSRENESSVVLYANFEEYGYGGILLTGDAGNEALQNTYNFAIQKGMDISQDLNFIQIPHHGSRRNVSPRVLNKIIGEIGEKPKYSITAFVSAGENDEKHPRRVVTNAFIRRGCTVVATQGNAIWYHHGNMPDRGWPTVEPIPFYDKVESYD